jgi:hypothetical protein
MQIPVMSDVQSAHRYTSGDIGGGFLIVHIRENLLVAEIGSFLELQVVIAEEGIIYRQDYQSITAILTFNAKAVFNKSGLRHCTKIFQLQNEVIRHGVISFGYGSIDSIEALGGVFVRRIREVRFKKILYSLCAAFPTSGLDLASVY